MQINKINKKRAYTLSFIYFRILNYYLVNNIKGDKYVYIKFKNHGDNRAF